MNIDNIDYYKRRAKTLKERKDVAKAREEVLRSCPTLGELAMIKKLEKLRYEFVFQKAFFNDFYFCIVDFFLPKLNLIIEVDGGYHRRKDRKEKDAGRMKYLGRLGLKVIRVTNTQAKQWGTLRLKAYIEKTLRIDCI